MIELQDVEFSYEREKILKNVTFSISRGEIIALIGLSGSGKTTLFRLMAGIEKADKGTIRGADCETISYMQQEDLLLPWRSILSNLLLVDELGRRPHNPKIAQRARRLLKAVGLEGYEEAMPHEISGGMRQRVSLVRALLQERPILLLDEPFGPLDVIVREELYLLLRSIREDYDKTIIMVTHDFRDAIALADRILVLANGEICRDIAVDRGKEAEITLEIRSCLLEESPLKKAKLLNC